MVRQKKVPKIQNPYKVELKLCFLFSCISNINRKMVSKDSIEKHILLTKFPNFCYFCNISKKIIQLLNRFVCIEFLIVLSDEVL